jgi:hypothetical protein
VGDRFVPVSLVYRIGFLQMTCTKYGCDYQLDLDGQVTCSNCGAMDDDKEPNKIFEEQVDFE